MSKLHVAIAALILFQGCGWNPLARKEDYLKRGQEFARQGKYEDAALQYRKAIQKDGKYGEAYLRLGQLFVLQDRPLESFPAFTRAVELMPDSREARAELGRTALTILLANPRRPQNVYDAVAKSSAALLAMDPKSVEGLRLRGYLQIADSKTREAIETFRQSLAIKPDQPEITTILVQTLLVEGQAAEAEKLARAGLETAKSYGPLYDTLYSCYISSKRPGEAEQVLKLKIGNNPKQAFYVTQLADHYWGQKKPEQAEQVIKGLLANSQNYPTPLMDAGDFYRRVGKLDEAAAQFKKGADSDAARKAEYRQRLGLVYLEQAKTQEAAALLDTILKEKPADPEALGARASLRMATGKPEEIRQAITDFVTLVQKAPQNGKLRLSLARASRANGQTNEARASLLDLLRRAPQDRAALREIADLSLRNRQPADALQYAERLLALDPNNVGARLNRTASLALLGRNNEVRGELRRLTAENPNLAEPWLQLAVLDTQEKKYGEAEPILRRLYKPGERDVRALAALVSFHAAQGQPQKGLALVKEEARLQPQSVDVRNLLAGSAADAGDLDLALSTLFRLASDFPQNPDYLVPIGQLSRQKGQADHAVANLQKATRVSPDNPYAYAELSQALSAAGRRQEAIQAARQGLKVQPEDPGLINNLAWTLALAGSNLDEAVTLTQKALQKFPKNPDFTDTLGMAYLKSKKTQEALQIFQPLVRAAPQNPVYRLHLAMAMIDAGQLTQARAELETALRSSPSITDADQIRKLQASLRNRQ